MKISSQIFILALAASFTNVAATIISQIADPTDITAARFIELYYSSSANPSVAKLVRYTNDNTVYTTSSAVDLTGATPGPDGYLIVCGNKSNFESIYPGKTCDIVKSSIQSNGDDKLALVDTYDTIIDIYGTIGSRPANESFENGRAVRDPMNTSANAGLFDVTGWIVTKGGLNAVDIDPRNWDGANDPVVTEPPSESPIEAGATASPSAMQSGVPSSSPTTSPTAFECVKIQDVQGNGWSSPMATQVKKVCGGYVTSILDKGFYIQDPNPEKNTTYSSGLYVYTGANDKGSLAVGDSVEVLGEIKEWWGMTQISAFDRFTVTAMPKIMIPPTSIILPFDNLEMYEGMYVSVETASGHPVIAESYNFQKLGEVAVCSERLYQYTDVNRPNEAGLDASLEAKAKSCVYVGDDNSSWNPSPAKLGGVHVFDSSTGGFRNGDAMTTLHGPLFWSYGKWNVQPTKASEIVYTSTPRPGVPSVGAGDIKLLYANLYNYWITLGGRGAKTAEEFDRQSTKTSLALSMVDADVIAVGELENLADATHDLAGKINARVPHRNYEGATVAGGIEKVGDDAIKVEVFFDSNKLVFLGADVLDDSKVSSDLLDQSSTGVIFNGLSRQPLAASFMDKSNGKKFTVVSCHYKSKGVYNGDPPGLDGDKGDGAGGWNHVRYLTTLAMDAWIKSFPTGVRTNNIIVTGDMNSYGQEDPVFAWKQKKYYSAVDYGGTSPRPFSYLFDGMLGSLDFAFLPARSTKQLAVNDAKIWHVNVDEPKIMGYSTQYGKDPSIFDGTIPYAYGDHDPIVLSLSFKCEDSTHRLRDGRDCDWVAAIPQWRCRRGAPVFCPMTCGKCPGCYDDMTKAYNGKSLCVWVSHRPATRCESVPGAMDLCRASCKAECQK